ncbi:FKBP-type peptidyl-prolyl cis-trans isomerase [Tautonia sociabilis]|uniref:Peptidyl-prolyl cis-trans isomerase n=1 Tax=Tautonia sociabilis TaxID=2080755 RepID=A0A432MK85_9BACT|nr:FKBP-type peptidyl-prolyl cis-trans isomerase [Tautonia sociabilis]RUL87536.1 FKBP-type peptidyl-prolyl cis-trans isomerase [Tautonia sociabilis]
MAGNATQIEDRKQGTGPEANPGQTVSAHSLGTLTNGTRFASSRDRGQPFSFPLGAGRVIKGWDVGVAGMPVGGLRKLTIPPEEGYGARGAGGVNPPNATLIVAVKSLGINDFTHRPKGEATLPATPQSPRWPCPSRTGERPAITSRR